MARAFIDGYQMQVSKPPTHIVHLGRLLDFLGTFDSRRGLTTEDVATITDALTKLDSSV
jgi:hypothetical protein